MARITRMLTGLLTRSAWLLPEDRAEWLEGLVAETDELRQGRARVVWLLGGVWLVAGDVLRRGALRVLAFIAAAAVVLGVAWPGSLSDSAVMVNRIEIPVYLVMLALAPLLVRRYFGPVADGLLPRAVRVAGYLIVLALITAKAVEAREGEKLGAYFHAAGKVAGLMFLVLAGYTAAIMILTSQRIRLRRSALAIAIGTGSLTGVALYALYGYHLSAPPLGWWAFAALALPLMTGLTVTRLAARAAPAKSMTFAQQGALVAVCAIATAVLLLAAATVGCRLGRVPPAISGDRVRGQTRHNPRQADDGPDSRPAGRLGRRLRDRNGDPAAGGIDDGHDRFGPQQGAAPDPAAPGERRVRNVLPQQSRDPARPQARVLGRTQHHPGEPPVLRRALRYADVRPARRRRRRRHRRRVTPHPRPLQRSALHAASRALPNTRLNAETAPSQSGSGTQTPRSPTPPHAYRRLCDRQGACFAVKRTARLRQLLGSKAEGTRYGAIDQRAPRRPLAAWPSRSGDRRRVESRPRRMV